MTDAEFIVELDTRARALLDLARAGGIRCRVAIPAAREMPMGNVVVSWDGLASMDDPHDIGAFGEVVVSTMRGRQRTAIWSDSGSSVFSDGARRLARGTSRFYVFRDEGGVEVRQVL
jgi:hypothetical protein